MQKHSMGAKRLIAFAFVLCSASIASAAECNGAPKPGTDDAGNFRFLRAIAERSPGFALLKEQKAPISCSYVFSGDSVQGEKGTGFSRLEYEAVGMKLRVERNYGKCTEVRASSLDFTPRSEAQALELLRNEVRFYAPGFERAVTKTTQTKDFSARVTDGHIEFFASIGCGD